MEEQNIEDVKSDNAMKQLLVIFAATTGYAKLLAISVGIMFILFLSGLVFWMWSDHHEVWLRNEVIAQQAIYEANHTPTEKEKLERAKAAHNTFLEAKITKMFLFRH